MSIEVCHFGNVIDGLKLNAFAAIFTVLSGEELTLATDTVSPLELQESCQTTLKCKTKYPINIFHNDFAIVDKNYRIFTFLAIDPLCLSLRYVSAAKVNVCLNFKMTATRPMQQNDSVLSMS